MEIKSLRYFLAVAREENMTKAADMLHVTQPTLSKTLKSLEDELGKKLFTRHSFSISLTDEGMLLRDRAEDLIGHSMDHVRLFPSHTTELINKRQAIKRLPTVHEKSCYHYRKY